MYLTAKSCRNFDAKFIIDKAGNVVERGSGSPMAFEKKIVELLA